MKTLVNEVGFTPGPWAAKPFLTPNQDDDPLGVYELNIRENLEQRYLDSNDYEAGSDEEQAYLDKLHAENQANARLIAAAPALLAALIELAECSPCRNGCAPDDMTCASNKARVAIRAATKET